MKILVGIPCMESIPTDTVNSLLHLKKDGHTVDFLTEALSVVHVARELIANAAIRGGYDYLLFIDSDMVFTPDLLRQLLKADKDIVTGLAFMRKPPFKPCIYTKMKIGAAGEKQEELLTDFDAGLIEVEGCGLACCLISVKALKALKERNSALFWPVNTYGEDLSFCIKARQAKFRIWADTRVKVGHIGHFIVTQADYEEWNGGQKE